jgi:poly(3-hydroxybutyrate) depolymerase
MVGRRREAGGFRQTIADSRRTPSFTSLSHNFVRELYVESRPHPLAIEIMGGGHTWPGRDPKVRFLGKYTKNISANDLMWEFFKKHPMK